MAVEPLEPSNAAAVASAADECAAPASANPPAAAKSRSPVGGALLFGLLALLVGGLVYRPTFSFELLTWDDNQHVTDNEYLQTITWRSFAHFWAYSYVYLYIPVSYNFYALEVWIAQWFPPADAAQRLNPAVFHIGNVLLHLGCTLLLYRLFWKLTRHAPAAFCGAMLFCLHPFQAESVSWVGETRGTLSTFLSLGAVTLYLRYAGIDPEQGLFAAAGYEPPRRRTRDYWLGFLLFGASLLAKPSAASFPLVVLVIEVVLLRRGVLKALWRMLPWLAAAAVVTGMTKYYQRNDLMFAPSIVEWSRRPLVVGDTYAFYLKKLVWPFDMAFDYGRTPQLITELPGFRRAWLLPSVVGLVLALLPRRRIWLGCYAIFLVALLPVSGLVPFIYQAISTVADRYMYVPLVGLGLMSAAWIASRRTPVVAALATTVVLGLFAHRTVDQCRTWRDDWTLYRHGLSVNPLSYMAHLNLGFRYRQDKQYEQAIRHYHRVVEIRPDYFWGDYNAGVCYMALQRYDDALREFRKAYNIYPAAFENAVGVGDAYAALGDFARAEDWYRTAVRKAPENEVPHLALGELLVRDGRYEEADEQFALAARLKPDSADVPRRHGRALLEAGRFAEAAPRLERRVALEPDDPQARIDLSSCYYSLSKFALAAEQAAAAVRLAPDAFEARHNYGLALAAVGKTAAAREQLDAALRLAAPGSPTAEEIRKALAALR